MYYSGYKSCNENIDVLLINKCIRHSMNIIQSTDHKIGIYQIKKILLAFFLWWQNMYSKQWILWISSWLSELITKNSCLNNYLKAFWSSDFFKF